MADSTPKHANVWAAFVAAQSEFKSPAQSGTNPHFKSRYSTLGDIFAATLPALNRHGLAFVQTLSLDDGGPTLISSVVLAETGESINSWLPMEIDANPQAFGSRLSYLKRYAAAALLAVVDGMDDDGEAASAAPQPRKASAPTQPQKSQPAPKSAATQDVESIDVPSTAPCVQLHEIVSRLHRTGRKPASEKAYQYLTGLVDACSEPGAHNAILSFLCDSEISSENVPSAEATSALIEKLAQGEKYSVQVEACITSIWRELSGQLELWEDE